MVMFNGDVDEREVEWFQHCLIWHRGTHVEFWLAVWILIILIIGPQLFRCKLILKKWKNTKTHDFFSL